jgi:hypothetical protein
LCVGARYRPVRHGLNGAIDEYFAGQSAPQEQTRSEPVASQASQQQPEASLAQQAGDWLTGGQSAGQIAEQAGRGLVNIPFDVLQGGASLINEISQGLGGPRVLDDIYRPVDRPTDPYAQTGEAIGSYLVPGAGIAGNMAIGSLAEAGNQQGDFAQNTATNAAINLGGQGAVSLLAKGSGSLARYVGNRGVESQAPELRNALTKGVQPSEINQTAKAVAESPDTSMLRRNVEVGDGKSSANVTPQAYRAAEEVRPNQSVLDAAKRLGMDDLLLPSHFSNNPTYRAIEQGLKSVPASQLAAKEQTAITALAQKADDLIEMAGGQQSRVGLSDKFKSESVKAIDDLTSKSDAIYSEISSAIPKGTPMTASNTLGMLNEKAKTVGGVKNLSAAERKILGSLTETREYVPNNMMQREWRITKQPTYGLVDNIRKQIGAAISKNQGPKIRTRCPGTSTRTRRKPISHFCRLGCKGLRGCRA